jgi:hypothetical protein
MRRNPAADWTMRDLVTLCARHGLRCTPPTGGGSHWKVSHPVAAAILTIPFRRPINPVYIRALVRMIQTIRNP